METKVRVVVRARPAILQEGSENCVVIKDNKVELITPATKAYDAVEFTFDGCYGFGSTQEEIFEKEVKPSLAQTFDGINTTVFAYGMTGAGKTHTMQGTPEQRGIIPRVAEYIMNLKNEKVAKGEEISILMSYLEIYNEKVYDLLNTSAKDLPIREDQNRNIFIPNLAATKIESVEAFNKVYGTGCTNRTTAATALNQCSSRSHAILVLKIIKKDKTNQKLLIGKLHLIDLAGSEDNRQTANKGMRMTESANINTSLFVLGQVVTALNEKTVGRVPYRDSKLTRMLQDSLGGNSAAIIIANVAPGSKFYSETVRTLNFASKSRKVVNRPIIHAEIDKAAEELSRKKKLEEWKKSKLGEPKRVGAKSISPTGPHSQILNSAEQKKSNSLIAPLLRNQQLLDQSTQDRLERLERALQQNGIPIPADTRKNKRDTSSDTKNCSNKKPKIQPNNVQTPVARNQEINHSQDFEESFDEVSEDMDESWLPSDDEKPDVEECKKLAETEHETVRKRKCKEKKLPKPPSETVHALSFLTPSTKRRTAMEFVSQGRIQEVMGNISNALALYTQANGLLDEEDTDLETRINNLQGKIQTLGAATSPGKENTENTENGAVNSLKIANNTAKILRVLNNGDEKSLKQLHGIGSKRAKIIVQHRQVSMFNQVEDLRDILGEKQLSKFILQNITEAI